MPGEYVDFGDAMTFDTTYKTNIYDKPLAMFVGSDHHLHNTVFGCALLGDEQWKHSSGFSKHLKNAWAKTEQNVF